MVDGKVLSESTAIQIWIARTFPQARLLPADPWQELKAISCFHGALPASIRFWPASTRRPGLRRARRRRERQELAASELIELFKIADDLLAGREYFFDHFTAADAHFFWTFAASAAVRSRFV